MESLETMNLAAAGVDGSESDKYWRRIHGTGGQYAGLFEGNVQVNGSENVTGGLTSASNIAKTPRIHGTNSALAGLVLGQPEQDQGPAAAVLGESLKNGFGVLGTSVSGDGVHGSTAGGNSGVAGENTGAGTGVNGTSVSGNAVAGESKTGNGGWFSSGGAGEGIFGQSVSGQGVAGHSQSGDGALFTSGGVGNGVWGETGDAGRSGVAGNNTGNGNGVWGSSVGGNGVFGKSNTGFAGYFDGNVCVTKDVQLTGGDCAEQFDVSSSCLAEPGAVMVINAEGELEPSERPYDKRVAGVVSGAGDLRPALILDKQKSDRNRASVALVGKVYCKVDADQTPVEVGDLLTTSATLGHAMKAEDPTRAFGAVIGKALRSLKLGKAIIPILVALQ